MDVHAVMLHPQKFREDFPITVLLLKVLQLVAIDYAQRFEKQRTPMQTFPSPPLGL